jgi:hypothetical protein
MGDENEKDYLERVLGELRAERSQLGSLLTQEQVKSDQKIEQIIRQAGIWDAIQNVKKEFEQFKGTLQRKNDHLGGKIEGLSALFDEYYRFAVEPGTRMYGIDISRLDWQTRARVMEGNQHTIRMLGGDPTGPATHAPPRALPAPRALPTSPPAPAPAPASVEPPKPAEPPKPEPVKEEPKPEPVEPEPVKEEPKPEPPKPEPEPEKPVDPPPPAVALRRRRNR